MIINTKFLSVILLCWPFVSMAAVDTSSIQTAETIEKAGEAANKLADQHKANTTQKNQLADIIANAIKSEKECDPTNTPTNTTNDDDAAAKEQRLKDLEDDYKAKKENEQSTANKTLTALTTAATGIGGMELARGLSEQKADKDAANSMAAYIATMRCTYGDGKQVKAGPDEIELPGGNNQQLMNLRAEYFALAADLKERKTALGMKPGIESEEILDKAATGLYDDETKGIDSGAYASLYRAQMFGSDADQAKIDAEQKASKNRVIAGAVVGGVGVVGGVVGNSLINGKLGEKIKELKDKKASTKENDEIINQLKNGLSSAGMKNVKDLDLSGFDMTQLKEMISNTDFTKLDLKDRDALQDINTSNQTSLSSSLESIFEQ